MKKLANMCKPLPIADLITSASLVANKWEHFNVIMDVFVPRCNQKHGREQKIKLFKQF